MNFENLFPYEHVCEHNMNCIILLDIFSLSVLKMIDYCITSTKITKKSYNHMGSKHKSIVQHST